MRPRNRISKNVLEICGNGNSNSIPGVRVPVYIYTFFSSVQSVHEIFIRIILSVIFNSLSVDFQFMIRNYKEKH